jgi:hypothetical protein
VTNRGWGLLTELTLPGGGSIGVYQPRHARPAVRSTLKPPRRKPARAKKAVKRPSRRKQARAKKRAKKTKRG